MPLLPTSCSPKDFEIPSTSSLDFNAAMDTQVPKVKAKIGKKLLFKRNSPKLLAYLRVKGYATIILKI